MIGSTKSTQQNPTKSPGSGEAGGALGVLPGFVLRQMCRNPQTLPFAPLWLVGSDLKKWCEPGAVLSPRSRSSAWEGS